MDDQPTVPLQAHFDALALYIAQKNKSLQLVRLQRLTDGDEGDRTLNPRLAKAVLSQLSYVPGALKKWAHEDSNFGPRPYQGRALTN